MKAKVIQYTLYIIAIVMTVCFIFSALMPPAETGFDGSIEYDYTEAMLFLVATVLFWIGARDQY